MTATLVTRAQAAGIADPRASLLDRYWKAMSRERLAWNDFEAAMASMSEMTLPQFRMFWVIASHGSQTMRSLGDATGVSPSALRTLVTALATRGLVSRRDVVTDFRTSTVGLTDRGRSLAETVLTDSLLQVSGVLSGLTDSELERYIEDHGRIERAYRQRRSETKGVG